MKSLKWLPVLAFAGILLTGCASLAYVEKDSSVNLANYKTYAWVETKEEMKADSAKTRPSQLTLQNIHNAVNAELSKVGWREVRNNPDVLLSSDVLVEKSTREQNDPVYSQPYTRYFFNPYTRRYIPIYYPSEFLGYDRNEYSVREATVTISMLDAKTDKMIWQGWTTDEVNSKNLTSKEIQSTIKSIFRKFDVAKK
ncbi:MAG: DUF4136 domain-containing protein [Chitinophagaceae bacterium]